MLAVYNIGISNKKGENMKEVKTFTDNQLGYKATGTEVNIKGEATQQLKTFGTKLVAEDMPTDDQALMAKSCTAVCI